MKFDPQTKSYVSEDGFFRLVWPPHDTDAQIAYDLRHGVIDYAVVGSNDSDLMYYIDERTNQTLGGVLYNFHMNSVGTITCVVYYLPPCQTWKPA